MKAQQRYNRLSPVHIFALACLIGLTLFTFTSASFAESACGNFLAEIFKKLPRGTTDNPFRISKVDCNDLGKMYDSGYGIRSGTSPFLWINDNEVIFLGTIGHSSKHDERDTGEPSLTRLFVWNISTGISVFKPYENVHPNYCVANSNFSFTIKIHNTAEAKDNRSVVMVTGSGAEEKLETITYRSIRNKRWNWFSCRYEEIPENTKGKVWRSLIPGHGTLLFGPYGKYNPQRNYKLELVPRPGGASIKLPIPRNEISVSDIRYLRFKKAYFLYDPLPDKAIWWRTNCSPYWWLWPSGKTEQGCIPAKGPWAVSGDWWVIPVKPGLVLISINNWKKTPLGGWGAYLVTNNKIVRLVSGLVSPGRTPAMSAVSPNGCRIAFGYSPNLITPSTVRILDLCDVQRSAG